MYQGSPSPPEGLLFKRNYFKIVDKAPQGLSWVRFWDLATSENKAADYTASVKMTADTNGNVYIDGLIRDRWQWGTVRKQIKQTALKERSDVLVGIESQGVQKGMVQECWADMDLMSVGILGIPVTQSKRIRASSLIARGEAGKLFLVRGAWNDAFIEEFIHFDVGEHDDQVDAASGAMHMLAFSSPGVVNLEDLINQGSEERQQSDPFYTFSVDDEDYFEERDHHVLFSV
jgi:predicted phage terminase large subunit-like protein